LFYSYHIGRESRVFIAASIERYPPLKWLMSGVRNWMMRPRRSTNV